MILLTLNSRQEAVTLHKYLTERLAHNMDVVINNDEIELHFEAFTQELKLNLTELLSNYLIRFYEDRWLIHIIKNIFYFTDEGDQEDILDIVHAIFEGEKSELPKVESLPSRHRTLRLSIMDVLKDPTSISMKSLETFRLNQYFNCLTQTIELAIDEFKLQQEYAAFVDKLRRIVKAYRPLHETIYAIDNHTFSLYDRHFNIIDDPHSIRSFYPLLKQWGIEAEPSLLLTLIGLAPENIYIFTDHPNEGMMLTLQKVFEERVKFFPKKEAEKFGLLFTG